MYKKDFGQITFLDLFQLIIYIHIYIYILERESWGES